jgi:hypothetical protein
MKNIHKINQNIYITSDEEIKEGDWVLYFKYNSPLIHKVFNPDNFKKIGKKIILTTDQDLIKDGIQAIDDEFLEWFIKNPSCEEVDVVKQELNTDYRSDWKQKFYYKIIIPKEEPKQEILEEASEDYSGHEEHRMDFIAGAKWQKEQDKKMYSEEEVDVLVDMLQKCKEYFLLKTDSKSEERADAIGEVLKQFKNK